VEDHPGLEFGEEVGAFGGHLFEVGGDLFDVFHLGRGDEATELTGFVLLAFEDFFEEMDVLEFGFGEFEEMFDGEFVEDGDAEFAPVGTLIGGELIHDLPVGEFGEEPGIVRGGAEPEVVLFAGGVDQFPGLPGGILSLADDFDFETGFQRFGDLCRSEVTDSRDETMSGKNCEAGIAHADEHHEGEIGRVLIGERTTVSGGDFVAVRAGGFVAVMAVGNKDRFFPH